MSPKLNPVFPGTTPPPQTVDKPVVISHERQQSDDSLPKAKTRSAEDVSAEHRFMHDMNKRRRFTGLESSGSAGSTSGIGMTASVSAERPNFAALKNVNKAGLLQILKKNPAVFPSLPNILFSFDIDCINRKSGDSERSIDGKIVEEVTKILSNEDSNQGILLTSNGEASHDVKIAKEMIALCVDRLFERLKESDPEAVDIRKKITRLVERIKLATPDGVGIVDFKYDEHEGKILHSDNQRYKDIKKESSGGTNKSSLASCSPNFSPRIVIFNNDIENDSDADAYLAVADVVLGRTSSSSNPNKAAVLAQDLHEANESLSLAIHPEKIGYRLNNDPDFRQAYHAFIADLVEMGNGTITVTQPAVLQRQNSNDLANKDSTDKEWKSELPYSAILDKLTVGPPSGLTIVNGAAKDPVDSLIKTMEAAPKKPLFWTINGNNHFPTHEGLQSILSRIAAKRASLNKRENIAVKDIILIAGNAPAKTPYHAGPIGKFTSPITGKLHGNFTEAQAIRDFLLEDEAIRKGYEFILETSSKNTMENLAYSQKELQKRGLDYAQAICVNSQSGFSGFRSALTQFGWLANCNMPESLHFINPDLSSATATDEADSKVTGQTFIQAVREFKNLTACLSQKIFNPFVPVPENLVKNYKTCLEKIGIDPNTRSATDIETWLDKMNQVAMAPNSQKLVGAEESYGTKAKAYAENNAVLRQQENLMREYVKKWSTAKSTVPPSTKS